MDREARLARLAAIQSAVFTRAQANAIGLSDKWLRGQVRRGSLVRLHRGVFISATVRVGPEQLVAAAVLACGPEAIASHQSAAFLWELLPGVEVPHVTVPIATSRAHKGIVVHRTTRIETTHRRGLLVTPPMRTLLDLAAVLPIDAVERALDDAHRRGLIQLARLTGYLDLDANRARPGAGEIRQLVAMRDGQRPTGSDLETLFFQALRKVNLPLPVAQHPVVARGQQRYIDFAYPEAMVAIELDSYEFHYGREIFEGDRARQNDLEELGWSVRRYTKKMIREDPIGTVLSVGAAIDLAPYRWRPRSGRKPA